MFTVNRAGIATLVAAAIVGAGSAAVALAQPEHESHHRSGATTVTHDAHDDRLTHHANDDRRSGHHSRHGADDRASHDASDDNGGATELRHGADDPASHDAGDDSGSGRHSGHDG